MKTKFAWGAFVEAAIGFMFWIVAVIALISLFTGCAPEPITSRQKIENMIRNPALHFDPIGSPIRTVAQAGARP